MERAEVERVLLLLLDEVSVTEWHNVDTDSGEYQMARCDDEIAHDLLHALDRHGYTIVKKTVPLPALRTGHSEVRTLVGGMTLVTHKQADCIAPCPVHAPSAHHMIAWRQLYRFDRGIMERNCEHGIGHPDPDDFAIINGTDDGTHGCDGCCVPLPQA